MEPEHTAPEEGRSSEGRAMHYSVGAVIQKDGKYLLLDRTHVPFGYAGPAGHVDVGEKPLDALHREVKEETGLLVIDSELLFDEEVPENRCGRGVDVHFWYLYTCKVEGDIKMDQREAQHMDWFTAEEMRSLALEPVWKYWFEKLGII